jgi:glycosyltransferase involved in cell wall biosynthesis
MAGSPAAVPDIAVVVPTRDREQLVGRLLHQLVRLDDGPTYEVIVVDEQSTDGTPALLARLVDEHGVRVVRHDPPKGLPAARNAGTAAATARYVAWIDDDDLTSPDRLRRQWEALQATGRRWSCAARVDVDDDLRIIGHMRCPAEDGLLAALLRFNCLPTAAQGLLVERSLADEVGGYDESLRSAEDWEFCIRLAAVGPPHLLDEPLVGYRTGFASMSTNTARMEESIQAVLDKHAALRAAHGVEPDWGAIHQSLLAADLLAGRGPAARRFVKALRASPSVRNGLRGLAILAAPGWFERQSAERRAAQVPDRWAARAREWLDSVPPLGDGGL